MHTVSDVDFLYPPAVHHGAHWEALVEDDEIGGRELATHQRRHARDLHGPLAVFGVPGLDDARADAELREPVAGLFDQFDAMHDEHGAASRIGSATDHVARDDGLARSGREGEHDGAMLREGRPGVRDGPRLVGAELHLSAGARTACRPPRRRGPRTPGERRSRAGGR